MDKVNLQTITEGCGIPYKAQIVVLDDIKHVYDATAPKQLLIEGFLFGIILQGNAHILIDNVEYCLEQGDIFGCNPRNILERSMLSIDLKILGIFVTPDYVTSLLKDIPVDWSFLMMASTHEVLHTNEEERDRMVDYINLLRKKLQADDTPNRQESIDLLIQSMGLEIFDIHSRQIQQTHQATYSPAENLIQRFLVMLSEAGQQGKPFLNVNGYAAALNVTPKYFSIVCKHILGKTASEIINENIMHTAKTLLRDNSLSIKMISDRLGFANQSHFGTFFRRYNGGLSPQDYRHTASQPHR